MPNHSCVFFIKNARSFFVLETHLEKILPTSSITKLPSWPRFRGGNQPIVVTRDGRMHGPNLHGTKHRHQRFGMCWMVKAPLYYKICQWLQQKLLICTIQDAKSNIDFLLDCEESFWFTPLLQRYLPIFLIPCGDSKISCCHSLEGQALEDWLTNGKIIPRIWISKVQTKERRSVLVTLWHGSMSKTEDTKGNMPYAFLRMWVLLVLNTQTNTKNRQKNSATWHSSAPGS